MGSPALPSAHTLPAAAVHPPRPRVFAHSSMPPSPRLAFCLLPFAFCLLPFAFCLARAAESTGTHPGGRNAEPSLRCQCLLIFVQRYKFELTKEHIDAIKEICKVAACEHTVAQPCLHCVASPAASLGALLGGPRFPTVGPSTAQLVLSRLSQGCAQMHGHAAITAEIRRELQAALRQLSAADAVPMNMS
jgi:hypothetical protein